MTVRPILGPKLRPIKSLLNCHLDALHSQHQINLTPQPCLAAPQGNSTDVEGDIDEKKSIIEKDKKKRAKEQVSPFFCRMMKYLEESEGKDSNNLNNGIYEAVPVAPIPEDASSETIPEIIDVRATLPRLPTTAPEIMVEQPDGKKVTFAVVRRISSGEEPNDGDNERTCITVVR